MTTAAEFHAVSARREAYAVGGLLMLFLLLASVLLSLIPVVDGELRATYSLSSSQIGLLTSILLVASAVAGVPMGLAAARAGSWILWASVGFIALGSVVFAISSSYMGFLAGRALQGLGAGAVVPICNPLMNRRLSPATRDRAMGIFGCGQGLGVIFALLVMPSVEQWGGYRAVFLVTAGTSVVIGLIALAPRTLRTPVGLKHENAAFSRAVSAEIASVAGNVRVLLLALISGVAMAVSVGVLVWTPGFLQYRYSSTLGVAAYLTAGIGLAQLAGNPLGAAGMSRWGKRAILLLSLTGMTAATALIPLSPVAVAAFVLVLLAGVLSGMSFPATLAAVPLVVADPRQVGPATGLLNVLSVMVAFFAPWVFGAILDAFGGTSTGKGYLLGYLVLAVFPLLGACAAVFLHLKETRL
jgi:MFS family permease